MAYKTFANGFPLPASDLNNYLMNQSVIVFADSTARTAALPTPTEGMITYLEDANNYQYWDGAAWTDLVEAPDLSTLIPKSTVTTAGDLIVADGASSVTRLGVGTDDQVLTLVSGAPAWADAGGGGGGFDTILKITASNSSYTLPALGSPIVKFTLIGGGGAGGRTDLTGSSGNGGNTSIVVDGTTYSVFGGGAAYANGYNAISARSPKVSANNGNFMFIDTREFSTGEGGEMDSFYVDLTGLSTINVTVGAGGTRTDAPSGYRGQVEMEYVSA